MSGNGAKEKQKTNFNYPGGPMFARDPQPMFEKDLMTAGIDVLASLPTAVFADANEANIACLYLGTLKMFGLEDAIEVALWRINATMAIDGRARDDAIQAHGRLYFPRHASKDDKKWLAEMQQMQRRKEQNTPTPGEPQ